jgi:hypothetical protein
LGVVVYLGCQYRSCSCGECADRYRGRTGTPSAEAASSAADFFRKIELLEGEGDRGAAPGQLLQGPLPPLPISFFRKINLPEGEGEGEGEGEVAKTTVRSLLLPLVGFSDLQYPGSYAMAPKSNSGGSERTISNQDRRHSPMGPRPCNQLRALNQSNLSGVVTTVSPFPSSCTVTTRRYS